VSVAGGRRTDLTALPPDPSGLHHVGRLPMHGLRREPEVLLDGEWELRLLEHAGAQDVPGRPVRVPGLWTMEEPSDRPHYTNVPMPFDEVPPAVPAHNPVGVYRRTVTLTPPTDGRRAILHVGAAEGHLRAYVNGTPVGASADSHLAAEFDVTSALVAGDNVVELVVTKWSAATYLEDQDQWWHSGLARSVFLSTVPAVRLADVVAVADHDPDAGTGALRLTVQTEGLAHLHAVDWSVEVDVLGATHPLQVGARIATQTLPAGGRDRSARPQPRFPPDVMDLVSITAAAAPVPPELRAIPDTFGQPHRATAPAGTAVLDLTGLDVPAWSAETPHLEDVEVRLVDPDGAVADRTRLRVGFRRVQVVGRDLLVNGRRILVQGVNRHDADPRTGRVMSPERIRAELVLLKRSNVNAIRCAHYPNDPVLLDLCDELGLYVVDEADVEGHAFASTIADDPRYLAEIVDRVVRMVQRDRNHPSVIVWSLGNETGYGAAHDAAAAWLRRADPTRPVQYEGAVATDWHGGRAATDVVCPMYPSFAALEAYSEDPRADRPLITCEYAYSQGNSTGGLADYWELFETRPGLQGGFVWELTDHALDPDGDGRYRYGGDFGDGPVNGATMLNGVAFADLTPKPALLEMRALFSPVRIVSGADEALAGTLRLRNRQTFADLSAVRLELRVEHPSGTTAHAGVPVLRTAPGAEETVDVPRALVAALSAPGALGLTVVVRTAQDAAWAPAGTEIAVHQVVVPREPLVLPAGRPAAVGADGVLRHPLLAEPPRLCLWRALVDNDASFALDQRFVRSGFFALAEKDVRVEADAGATVVTTTYAAAFGDEVVHRREIAEVGPGDWVLREEVRLPEGTRDGLRVGMVLELVDGFDDVRWVGLGPGENYPDRCASATLGAWSSSVEDMAVPYLIPQENGTRGGTTELEVTGPAGRLRTEHDTPLHVNVARHRVDELEAATHWWRLPAAARTVVHLDVAHRGLGTALLGPDTRPRHRLAGDSYSWRWRLTLAAR
jgi:beta-galactosidase